MKLNRLSELLNFIIIIIIIIIIYFFALWLALLIFLHPQVA